MVVFRPSEFAVTILVFGSDLIRSFIMTIFGLGSGVVLWCNG